MTSAGLLPLSTLVLNLVLGFAVGKYAESRGRNRGAWLLLSLVVSPLVTFILINAGRDYRVDAVSASRRRR
jgi:hypothetical protein